MGVVFKGAEARGGGGGGGKLTFLNSEAQRCGGGGGGGRKGKLPFHIEGFQGPGGRGNGGRKGRPDRGIPGCEEAHEECWYGRCGGALSTVILDCGKVK